MKKRTLITALMTIFLSCVKEKGISCGSVSISAEWGGLSKSVGMSLIFYPENGGTSIRYEITPEGYTCSLPEGKYKVLLFNNDTKNIQFRNIDKYESAEASVIPMAKSEQIISQPDMLYGSAIDEITIEQGKVIRNKVKISAYTKNIIANINVITNDGQTVKGVSATLKGTSHSLFLSTGCPVYVATPGSIEMNSQLNADGNITVTCSTFGTPFPEDTPDPTETPRTMVQIATAYDDNTQKTITADISEIIHTIQRQDGDNTAVIELRDMGLVATVISWKTGMASGSINK